MSILSIEIESENSKLAMDLASIDGKLNPGERSDVPGGVVITYIGSTEYRSIDLPTILQFTVDITVGVNVGLFTAWLYDKLKGGRAQKIRIHRTEITTISEQEIKRILEESLEIDE